MLPALAFTADVLDGRWDAPDSGWANDLAFTQASTDKGEFRMLWVGDPACCRSIRSCCATAPATC